MNAAIERALRDGDSAYATRGILVLPHLEATTLLDEDDPALTEAIYTIFRALPERLAPGASLLIATRDRAGGDIELLWEASELLRAAKGDGKSPFERGPYSDLLALAIAGLDDICRVRMATREDDVPRSGASSSLMRVPPRTRRRHLFLIPVHTRRASGGGA